MAGIDWTLLSTYDDLGEAEQIRELLSETGVRCRMVHLPSHEVAAAAIEVEADDLENAREAIADEAGDVERVGDWIARHHGSSSQQGW
jgi:hypothetical protein